MRIVVPEQVEERGSDGNDRWFFFFRQRPFVRRSDAEKTGFGLQRLNFEQAVARHTRAAISVETAVAFEHFKKEQCLSQPIATLQQAEEHGSDGNEQRFLFFQQRPFICSFSVEQTGRRRVCRQDRWPLSQFTNNLSS